MIVPLDEMDRLEPLRVEHHQALDVQSPGGRFREKNDLCQILGAERRAQSARKRHDAGGLEMLDLLTRHDIGNDPT
jgi:hypothetical protein